MSPDSFDQDPEHLPEALHGSGGLKGGQFMNTRAFGLFVQAGGFDPELRKPEADCRKKRIGHSRSTASRSVPKKPLAAHRRHKGNLRAIYRWIKERQTQKER